MTFLHEHVINVSISDINWSLFKNKVNYVLCQLMPNNDVHHTYNDTPGSPQLSLIPCELIMPRLL